MKNWIGFLMVILNLEAMGAEQKSILCSNQLGEVSITIKENCLSIVVKKNLLKSDSFGSTPLVDHAFSTCDIGFYRFDEHMEQSQNNSRSGQWITYHANNEECWRPGCIYYKAAVSFVDPHYDGSLKLVTLSTSKVGSNYYQFNEQYILPQELKSLSCKTL